jgi:mRNA interferase YafQ
MDYILDFTGKFKKDFKTCKKRNYDISLIETVLLTLREKGELSLKYKPHKLSGNYEDCWECHIKPDWLLIWRQDETNRVICLERTGTHYDLF